MTGKDFVNRINQLLAESNSTWIDLKSSFDYVYEASKDFAKETGSCHNVQTFPTVAGQANYPLNSDFLEVLTKDDDNKALVKYVSGSNTLWLSSESYSDYLQTSNPNGTPNNIAITDAPLMSRITGTITSAGNQTGGESILTDSAQNFSSLYPGDEVINTSTGYSGVVISLATYPVTAMFDLTVRGGAYASWSLNDTYMIQPAPRYQIFLDPAPAKTGDIVTVNYTAKPIPVYSDYGIYPFATGYEEALIKYATWLYKYRDSKPQLGDPLFMAYERAMRKGKNVNRKAIGSKGFRVNFRCDTSRPWS